MQGRPVDEGRRAWCVSPALTERSNYPNHARTFHCHFIHMHALFFYTL